MLARAGPQARTRSHIGGVPSWRSASTLSCPASSSQRLIHALFGPLDPPQPSPRASEPCCCLPSTYWSKSTVRRPKLKSTIAPMQQTEA